jgi:hypothetical protein
MYEREDGKKKDFPFATQQEKLFLLSFLLEEA